MGTESLGSREKWLTADEGVSKQWLNVSLDITGHFGDSLSRQSIAVVLTTKITITPKHRDVQNTKNTKVTQNKQKKTKTRGSFFNTYQNLTGRVW